MASNADFVQYVADQCADAGDIVTKKMFGEYGIYCNGKIFGLICDDKFYLKPTQAGQQLLKDVRFCPPYEGAKDYFLVEDVDDHERMAALVRATCQELPEPKIKKKASKKV